MALKGFDKERPRFRVSVRAVCQTLWGNRVCFRASSTNTTGGMFNPKYFSAGFLYFYLPVYYVNSEKGR